ncbi:MAG: ion transporter [Planctomycetota bacterium]
MAREPQTLRERIHEIIFEADTRFGKAFDVALIALILLSVLTVVIHSTDWASNYNVVFNGLEWFFTGVFAIEYLIRLIIVKKPIKYATSFFGIIDLLSILPAFIGLVVPNGSELLVVRMLRLLRVFRVFKLARFLTEASSLKQALIVARHKIAVFITAVLIIVVIASAVMHVVEGASGNEGFKSIPDAMYWAIITMTTVGYGDATPQTGIGKAITAALTLTGYAMIIVPTGIISAELSAPHKPRSKLTTQVCPSCTREGHDADAVHCKFCGETL